MDAADYVLRNFSAAERRDLGVHVERAADAAETLIAEGLEKAQGAFNAPQG
jgi:PTH1 family peptidyl-tRNA hydrolase